MIPLIDGDIILYTIAYVVENLHDEDEIRRRVNKYTLKILADVKCEGQYLMFLTGKNNYRKEIYPNYKISRKDKPKPRWFEFLRTHLIEKWNAIVVENIEADDALSITHRYYTGNNAIQTIVCSRDKDLLQIPGLHYRIPTKSTLPYEIITVSEEDAFKNLMQQAIMGDATDDIPGIKGIGPVKSEKMMENVTIYKLFDVIIRKYIATYGEAGVGAFWINYELVKLLEYPDKGFIIPPFSTIDTTTINKFKDKYEQQSDIE